MASATGLINLFAEFPDKIPTDEFILEVPTCYKKHHLNLESDFAN
jgi:hypothetical protein